MPQGLTELTYKALVTLAADSAQQSVLDTINVYLAIAGVATAVIIALLGFIGYSQLSDIKKNALGDLKREIESSLRNSVEFRNLIKIDVEQDIQSGLQENIRRLEKLISIGRLNSLTERMDEQSSFSRRDADLAVTSLLDLKDDSEITQSAEFVRALELSIKSFHQAGHWQATDALDAALSGIVIEVVPACILMMESFGMRCLGEQGLTHEENEHLSKRMLFYARALIHRNYSEIANQYLLAYEIWKNGKSDRADRIVSSLQSLNPHELSIFLHASEAAANSQELVSDGLPRAEIIAFSEKMRKVQEVYQSELDALRLKLIEGATS